MCPRDVSLEAVADTYIDADNPDTNKGGDRYLKTSPESGKEKHGLLRFDLSSIPGNAVLQSAALRVTSDNGRSDHEVEIREMRSAWNESAATWNSPDGSATWAGGAFGSADYGSAVYGVLIPVGDDTQLAVDLSSVVSDWLSGSPNHGLVMRATNVDTGDAQWFSRQESKADLRPQLAVQYLEPVPGGCSETSTLAPVADTFINADRPDENKGGDTRFRTRPESSAEKHGLVLFDLSGVPSGAVIDAATLTLVSKNGRSNHAVEVHALTAQWSEMGATWNSPDGVQAWAGGAFGSADYDAAAYGPFVPVGGDAQVSVDVTALVDRWVNQGLANHGVLMLATGVDNGDAEWYSIQESNASRHPVLVVHWTLLPGQ
jgi:hypothetical protein